MLMFGVVSGLDVNQCPGSMDLFIDNFDVEQLIVVNKVKRKLVRLIATFICDSLVVNCQCF